MLPAILLTALAAGAPFYADKSNLLVYIDSQGKQRDVLIKRDFEQRRRHILANMQEVMGPLPTAKRPRLDMRVLEETDTPHYVRRKITFHSEKDRVPAYLLIPKNKAGKLPAMLCLHQTIRIGKAEPAGLGTNVNLRYASELAERGFVTLAPDYPGFGDYKIDVYELGYQSATMKGIWNHIRAVDLLISLKEVNPKRIGVIGHSLGGHNSLFAAAFDPRIRAVVTSCGFNAFPKYMKGDITGWSHKGYMPRIASQYGKDPARMPFDFTEVLGALAPRPVFINAPEGDANFEVSGVRDCVAAAMPVYERIFGVKDRLVAEYPDAKHEFPPAIREKAYQFLERWLR